MHDRTKKLYTRRNHLLKNLGYENYQEYLESDHWRDVKVLASKDKRLKKRRCKICKFHEDLNLHHKTYRSLGNEDLNHLIWLCSECHEAVHEIVNEEGVNLWVADGTYRKRRHSSIQNREVDYKINMADGSNYDVILRLKDKKKFFKEVESEERKFLELPLARLNKKYIVSITS